MATATSASKRITTLSAGVADMTHEQLDAIMGNAQHRNFVAPVCDTELGRQLFFAGSRISRCRNEMQRAGWLEAEHDARRMLRSEWLAADMHQIAEA